MNETIKEMIEQIWCLERLTVLSHVQLSLVTPKGSRPCIYATDGQRTLKHARIPDSHLPQEQTLAYRLLTTFGANPRP
jgi:hypothetical protein